MRIAVPMDGKGFLCGVFSRASALEIYDVNLAAKSSAFVEKLSGVSFEVPADILAVLKTKKVETLVLCGIACKIKSFFEKNGVAVLARNPNWEPFRLAQCFAEGKLPEYLL